MGACAGARLRPEQWLAVLLATAGLVGYELASRGSGGRGGGDDARAWGSILALVGSAGHSYRGPSGNAVRRSLALLFSS